MSLIAVAVAAVLSIVGRVAPPTGAATGLTPSLTTSATDVTWSQYVTLTATFAPAKGQPKPTGTVTFFDQDGTIGSIALANGVARLRTRDLPAGTHAITAIYGGDGTYPDGSTTGGVDVTVLPAQTTTTLVSKKPEVLSGSAWFQATVAPVAPAGGTPTGSVDFILDGAEAPAATVPLVGGIATWRPRLPDGAHTLFAIYTGTASQYPSSSNPIGQRVGPEPSAGPVDQATTPQNTESLAQPTADSPYAQTVTTGRNGWLDQVDLFVGASGDDSDLTVRIFAVGDDGLPTGPVLGLGRAYVYGGTAGPVSLPLDVPIAVRTGERYALVAIAPAEQIFLAHDSTDSYPGGAMLGQLGGEWSPVGPVDLWFQTHVTPWATTELTVSTASAVVSQPVDLTARWTVARNAPAPSGTVHFLVDDDEIGTAPIIGGTARLRTRALTLGDHTITATYDGDEDYDAEPVSGSPTVTVGPLETTTTVVSRRNPVVNGTAWFQATVAPVAPATAAPDGEVAFFLDGASTPATVVPLSAGVATWRPRLADGPHTVVAGFVPGTPTQQASTSAPVAQHIGTPPAAEGSIDQSNSGDGTSTTPGRSLAQTFTVGATGMLHRVAYNLPYGGTVGVAIHALGQDGLPTGAPLASAGSAFAQGYTERSLDVPLHVRVGEQYALVLTSTDGVSAAITMASYDGGFVAYTTSDSGSWQPFFFADLEFATWVRPIPPTTATITVSDAGPVWSQYVTLTARWTSPDGGPVPTGTVRFYDGEVLLGTATISEGVAQLRTKALALGARTASAVYSGDASFPPGPVAEPITVPVAAPSSTTTLVSKKTEVLSGSAWFQATVAPAAPATATPTGSVAFSLEGVEGPAAIVPLVGGIATWRPRLADGSYTVTATYLGGSHNTSDSSPLVQVIGPS